MNDEIEHLLSGLTPRGAPERLRREVLKTAGSELSAGPVRCCGFSPLLSVAAMLVLAVALNCWAASTDDALQARLFGPVPVPRQIADITDAVRSVTDVKTAEFIQRQLTEAQQRTFPADGNAMRAYQEWLIRLANGQGSYDENPQKGAQVDRGRLRPLGGDPTGDQRHPGLAHRFTA